MMLNLFYLAVFFALVAIFGPKVAVGILVGVLLVGYLVIAASKSAPQEQAPD
jgi:hypothetical protein